ncbi:MAG: hypothetical protein EOS73_24735 [Mesorhizobium sp.]|uniref:hypothetical protein n=1 Tax=Mesorhizobium sp. M7A.F.Ca.ET.027.02.1.1 TaxID=2496655 RepID=UPI000FD43ED4|nr:hypothetical protein [Mesorhizobium sp. M7A.F.Ca.ET.027.02.1.1]RVD14615.1 hypothetical protein EN749_18985 [Mesorhizobium sp. M7A.F.Ca.ET.027.02.1.1]RWD00992.1 MAG: hypothetical protein EOS73_24735 [Mesorhizobium sp.]
MAIHNCPTGVGYPDDLSVLKQVFDKVCAEEGIAVGSSRAERLSVDAMLLFTNGEWEEAMLYDHLRDLARRAA